jgi:hypothetical protein
MKSKIIKFNHKNTTRHGDILVCPIPENVDVSEIKTKPVVGTSLMDGEVTGHAHRFVGKANLTAVEHQRADMKFLETLKDEVFIKHEEHKAFKCEPGQKFVVLKKRQYDPENGWAPVQD